MTNTTKLLVAALAAAVGCSGTQQAREAEPTARSEVQSPTEVAGYESRAEAEPAREKKKELDPNTPLGRGMMQLEDGDLDAAAATFRDLTAAEPDNAKAWLLYGYALHTAGKLDEALAVHQRAATFEKTAPIAHYNVACVHALQGDLDAAFAALDRAAAAGFHKVEHLAEDEDLANLRDDPRFSAFVDAVEANAARHEAHEATKSDGAECEDRAHGDDAIQ